MEQSLCSGHNPLACPIDSYDRCFQRTFLRADKRGETLLAMPIPVISVEEMRSWEAATWAVGIQESEVIGRVGQAIADWLLSRMPPWDSILIVAGKGHNGDDGRAAFQCLSAERGASLLDVRNPEQSVDSLERALSQHPSVILDCLFGIGLNRDLSQAWQAVIRRINQAGAMIVAVDIPSGLNAQTGFPMGAGIQADYTLTIGAPKAGMLTSPARPFVGYLRVLPEVGLLSNFFSATKFGELWKREDEEKGQSGEKPAGDNRLFFSREEDFRGFPPPRRATDHKGSFGHLAILAGSRGYHGAAVLASRGAMRACPGLITLSTTLECYLPAASHLQQAMVQPWRASWQPPAKATGILAGPGLAGTDVPDRLMDQLRRLWREDERPVLVDASGLDWLPQGAETAGPRVITPHAGEAARLLQCRPAEVNENRIACLRELSSQFGGCWVVLKGAHSLIGRKQGAIFFNATGTPGLAQGGSGDVLAGFLAGLLSQPRCQNDPETALRYGVWKHGEAAERLQKTRNNWTSEELPAALHL